MKCLKCKGQMLDGFTTFVADTDDCCIVIRRVPCKKCEDCGEVVFTAAVAMNLERMVKIVRSALAEVTVINYRDAVA